MKRLSEEDIVLQNMISLALRSQNGGLKFANQVLNALPSDRDFIKQFVKAINDSLGE